ncbi:MAG TPA: hypothetical protein VFP84_17185 [Kofleriaceae bacterium]|nr:hypothetical protein [Kofleriaceae bacterium]
MPDAGGGSGGGSDAAGGPGLFVTWDDNPRVPGPLTSDIDVTSVSFQIRNFQLLADAGSVNRAGYLLNWSPSMRPTQEMFSGAPAGVYSRVAIELGGAQVGYATQIQGVWHDHRGGGGGGGGGGPGPGGGGGGGPGPGGGGGGGGNDDTPTPFLIQDRKSLPISFACSEEVEATASTSFGVRLDLRDAISHIDFTRLAKNGDGTLVLDNASDQMADFRDRLSRAFDIEDSDDAPAP